MTTQLQLPTLQGAPRRVALQPAALQPAALQPAALQLVALSPGRPATSRTAYAAVHVVADAWAEPTGNGVCRWDPEATLAFRHHVWDQGLGVAEAMDTAQRGMGLGWDQARDLIALTLDAAEGRGGAEVVVGVAADQLEGEAALPLRQIVDAYLEQLDFVESRGGRAIIMASRALARSATSAADYEEAYRQILSAARRPVMLHWLGEAFDPLLRGYWGGTDLEHAAETVLRIMETAGPERVSGIKLSLLDQDFEVRFRARLDCGQIVFTGDDFNYPALIAGDGGHFSHALLGVFDAIAPLAGAALRRLDEADRDGFRAILDPTLPLARHVFSGPTQYYKVGVVFLAWLNGHQDHFRMIGGLEGQRSLAHLLEVAELAAACGALQNPALAQERIDSLCRMAGVA